MRDTLKHESRIARKPEARVEQRIANQHTTLCPDPAEFGKALLHQRSPDATALPLGFDRNWTKPIPACGTITDGYWRKGKMPHDTACIFCDKRNRKCMIRSQGADDELLGLMAVWMREKSTSSDLLNSLFV